jgi:hypothetical protein
MKVTFAAIAFVALTSFTSADIGRQQRPAKQQAIGEPYVEVAT